MKLGYYIATTALCFGGAAWSAIAGEPVLAGLCAAAGALRCGLCVLVARGVA
ncbi:hypothetical protein UFOVP823_15 [uncultured Caudovirales phage]|uniref:Uncharacterized protein n=1 Tax=uncultured Caudovirales phage TaxID=2100421 RepID=A0A6J5P208_9CAUD|nr:hypothetical protein UFOVP823_15 [uncultured Caudovirales phage]